ncbi:MAG: histidine phosphatase family protein [Pseudomonadota bacterium]
MIVPVPRRLVLLRHAKSSWDYPELRDRDRPLAPRGERAAALMADEIDRLDLQTEWVACSTAVRTRQTWALVAPSFARAPVELFDPDLYLATVPGLLARIAETPPRVASLLVIGHNPGFQDLATFLARADPELRSAVAGKLPTCALLAFSFDVSDWGGVASSRGELLAWRTPAMVERER